MVVPNTPDDFKLAKSFGAHVVVYLELGAGTSAAGMYHKFAPRSSSCGQETASHNIAQKACCKSPGLLLAHAMHPGCDSKGMSPSMSY